MQDLVMNILFTVGGILIAVMGILFTIAVWAK
jgi:hypothetical protein